MSDDRRLVLASNSILSKKLFPDNTASDFITRLPSTLSFDRPDAWEMAITSIDFPIPKAILPMDSLKRVYGVAIGGPYRKNVISQSGMALGWDPNKSVSASDSKTLKLNEIAHYDVTTVMRELNWSWRVALAPKVQRSNGMIEYGNVNFNTQYFYYWNIESNKLEKEILPVGQYTIQEIVGRLNTLTGKTGLKFWLGLKGTKTLVNVQRVATGAKLLVPPLNGSVTVKWFGVKDTSKTPPIGPCPFDGKPTIPTVTYTTPEKNLEKATIKSKLNVDITDEDLTKLHGQQHHEVVSIQEWRGRKLFFYWSK